MTLRRLNDEGLFLIEKLQAIALEPGAVWAAVRIPEGNVGVSANIPRISMLNLNDPYHYMASENVHSC